MMAIRSKGETNMQPWIEIRSFHKDVARLILNGIGDVYSKNLSASGQMLVDSDQLAFIYILENETEYIHVRLPIQLWPLLNEVISNKLFVVLKVEEIEIELVNIIDELTYLIHNIEGNSNYGDEMVKKVEEIFLT